MRHPKNGSFNGENGVTRRLLLRMKGVLIQLLLLLPTAKACRLGGLEMRKPTIRQQRTIISHRPQPFSVAAILPSRRPKPNQPTITWPTFTTKTEFPQPQKQSPARVPKRLSNRSTRTTTKIFNVVERDFLPSNNSTKHHESKSGCGALLSVSWWR